MKRPALLLLAAAATAVHAATDADLLRCRALADNAARLACYDALVASPAAATAPAAAGTAAAAPTAAVAAAAAPAAAPAAAAAAPVAVPAPAQRVEFGFEARAWQQGADFIESRILGRFEGWEPNARIRLENGQVWQITDDSRGVMIATDPKVKVSRGSFGTFFLEIEGKRQAPRVKRVE